MLLCEIFSREIIFLCRNLNVVECNFCNELLTSLIDGVKLISQPILHPLNLQSTTNLRIFYRLAITFHIRDLAMIGESK